MRCSAGSAWENEQEISSSRKVGGANKGLGEAPKSYTRKEHESATNSIAKRGQGAMPLVGSRGEAPLWGLGQRPNCSAGDHHLKCTQQRRRQRSVPAPNFARPQTRPQAASLPSFREEPNNTIIRTNWKRREKLSFLSPGIASRSFLLPKKIGK